MVKSYITIPVLISLQILFTQINTNTATPTDPEDIKNVQIFCQDLNGGEATCDNCLNNICEKCNNSNSIYSKCHCSTGQYIDPVPAGTTPPTTPACKQCDANCLECMDTAKECTECKEADGWKLNLIKKTCECALGWKGTNGNCVREFKHKKGYVSICPSGYTANKQYFYCEKSLEEDIDNDDDTVYIITTIVIIVIVIVLAMLFYKFLYKIFNEIFLSQSKMQLPLSEEEKFFLANQQELERQRKLREEELARQLAEEEAARREEEERRRREKEEMERKLREEEEERRREQEEAERRRLEEEEMRRRAEEEALRQMQEEAERRRLEEEARLRALAEEEERKRLEEEERKRREAEEAERRRLLELARQAANQRKLERQMTRQKTMADRQSKMDALKAEKERLAKEAKEMEDFNEDCLKKAGTINKDFDDINANMEKARLRREQTMSIKQNILQRQQTIADARKQVDSELEGIDFAAAQNALKAIGQEDIVFMQNLRTPPEKIRMCMEAVVMLLNNSTKKMNWDDIKKEIDKMSFKKDLITYSPDKMGDKVYNKIQKEYLNSPQWNLPKMMKASPVVGAFATWVSACVKFKQIQFENAPLFEKLKAIKAEQAAMEEEEAKLVELEDEAKQCEEKQKELENETEALKDKQKGFQKQATLNLGDIEERKKRMAELEQEADGLAAIEESEEDDESSIASDVDVDF